MPRAARNGPELAGPASARERHIGAAQPGAQPTWDLSSVTMDQRMADLVRV